MARKADYPSLVPLLQTASQGKENFYLVDWTGFREFLGRILGEDPADRAVQGEPFYAGDGMEMDAQSLPLYGYVELEQARETAKLLSVITAKDVVEAVDWKRDARDHWSLE